MRFTMAKAAVDGSWVPSPRWTKQPESRGKLWIGIRRPGSQTTHSVQFTFQPTDKQIGAITFVLLVKCLSNPHWDM